MDLIPQPEIPESTGLIPQSMVRDPQSDAKVEPEMRRYRISFDKYIEDECGINDFDGHHARSALKVMRDIGLHFADGGFSSSESPWIEPIHRDSDRAKNEYAVFYKGIEEDAEIKEIKVKNTVKAVNPLNGKKERREIDYRVFFYITPADRTFHVRAISDVHKNIRNKPRNY